MTINSMMPIERLKPALAKNAPPGTLLIPYEEGDALQLRFDVQSDKCALYLDKRHKRSFCGVFIDARHKPALCLADWQLRVDPQSAYSTFGESPQLGDVFFSKSGAEIGFIGSIEHFQRYITIDGRMIPEPKWAEEEYVGFRRWSVGYADGDRLVDLLPSEALT